MREIRTSGLMSGDGKRGDAGMAQATAPVLNSTEVIDRAGEGGRGGRRLSCGSWVRSKPMVNRNC